MSPRDRASWVGVRELIVSRSFAVTLHNLKPKSERHERSTLNASRLTTASITPCWSEDIPQTLTDSANEESQIYPFQSDHDTITNVLLLRKERMASDGSVPCMSIGSRGDS